jgi:hypothetical protein
MKIFDDLADPLGPPDRDALRAVLTRVRRRRAARRGSAVLLATIGAVVIAVALVARVSDSKTVSAVGPKGATSVPSSSRASSPSTATVPTTATTSTQPKADDGPWSGTRLTITPRSLGAVRVGMTLAQAQSSAGVVLDGRGDGAFYPTRLPTGFPHLFVRQDAYPTDAVTCVGAEVGDPATNPQQISTADGFRLGDTVARLKAIYGSRAHYSPAPSSGISPRAGYVVTEAGGSLAFSVDATNTRIVGIMGAASNLTPSSCSG